MKCENCGSENVSIQMINEAILKNKHHSIVWWLLIGFWWIPLKWLFFTLPALILKIFGHQKKKIVNKKVKMAVCQKCGNSWKIN